MGIKEGWARYTDIHRHRETIPQSYKLYIYTQQHLSPCNQFIIEYSLSFTKNKKKIFLGQDRKIIIKGIKIEEVLKTRSHNNIVFVAMSPQKFPCVFPLTACQSHLIAFTCFVLNIPVVFSCHFVFILFFFCIVHCTVVISFSLPHSVWCWKKISNKLVSTSIHHTSTKMEEKKTSSW